MIQAYAEGAACVRVPRIVMEIRKEERVSESGRLILMVGSSGSGKSTYARENFSASCILSADQIRKELTGDESNQGRNRDVFSRIREETAKRLRRGRTVVIDNTNVQKFAREEFYWIAGIFSVSVEARVMSTSLDECLRRNGERERKVPEEVIRKQFENHLTTLAQLPQEGLSCIVIV